MNQERSPAAERAGRDDNETTIGVVRDDAQTTLGVAVDDTATSIGGSIGSRPASEQLRLEPGQSIIGGRYTIERSINGGVEADAYVGRSILDRRPVFIKHLRGFRTGKADIEKKALIIDRLLRIDHPNCVRVLDAEIATDHVIEVYELVEGRSLADVLRGFSSIPDRTFVRELIAQVAAGLQHLHALDLAHRDLKPDNILMSAGAPFVLKIGDYGTMSAVDEGGKTTFAGTRRYAPPEAQRLSLLRDADLMASDWWSVGRIIQEIVDGEHAYDRIAKHFPAVVASSDVQPIFDAIMSEQERHVYGVRAGMVEWSDPAWQAPLRGLLTSKRQFRWGYRELMEWHAGGAPEDAYDTAIDVEPFVFKGRRYDAAAAARVLAQPENWEEAVRQIFEKDGLRRYVKHELQNKRLETRLADVDSFYDRLIEASVPSAYAEEICTALALRLIAGDSMPITLNGKIVSPELVREYAAATKNTMVWALLSDDFRERVRVLDSALASALDEMSVEMNACLDVLKGWNANESTTFMWDRFIHFRYADKAELLRIVAEARATLSHTTIAALNAVFLNDGRSERELAMLAFVLQSPVGWLFVTKQAAALADAQATLQRANVVSSSYGYAVMRKYHALGGALFLPWWAFVIAGVVTGFGFAVITIVVMLVLAAVLRKTLTQFYKDQVGPDAWFRGRNPPERWTKFLVETYGKDEKLDVISRELDDLNRRLEEYGAIGIRVAPAKKLSPKFGALAVVGIVGCLVIPIPLSIVLTIIASFLAAVGHAFHH